MDLINLQLYPLDKPGSLEYKKCIEKLRFEMSQTGVAACPNFLKNEAISQAVQDTELVKHKAWLTDTMRNIYLDSGDEKYPENHIRNRLTHCMVASVANDFLPSNGILSRLYATDQVAKFIQDILQLERIFRVVDPIACMFVNLAQPGWPTVDPWHFDESPFAATILLQKPDQYGDFETTLPIRNGHGRGWTSKSKEDDLAELKHYETMQDIVEGKADHLITKLSFEPGQLNLFQGRQCLHRVTPCQGTKDRMVAVLNYSPFPGMRKSKEVQEMFWGRSSDL